MKPTFGGGIYAALFAADFVAREARLACAPATSPSAASERCLRAHQAAWWSSLGREMRRGYDLRRVFERVAPSLLERLFDALEHPRLLRTIERVGDIDFPSRVVWAIARHDPMLAMAMASMPRFPMAWVG